MLPFFGSQGPRAQLAGVSPHAASARGAGRAPWEPPEANVQLRPPGTEPTGSSRVEAGCMKSVVSIGPSSGEVEDNRRNKALVDETCFLLLLPSDFSTQDCRANPGTSFAVLPRAGCRLQGVGGSLRQGLPSQVRSPWLQQI